MWLWPCECHSQKVMNIITNYECYFVNMWFWAFFYDVDDVDNMFKIFFATLDKNLLDEWQMNELYGWKTYRKMLFGQVWTSWVNEQVFCTLPYNINLYLRFTVGQTTMQLLMNFVLVHIHHMELKRIVVRKTLQIFENIVYILVCTSCQTIGNSNYIISSTINFYLQPINMKFKLH